MANSPKHVNMRPASELRNLLLGIPMNIGPSTTAYDDPAGRGRSWGRKHRHLGALHPLVNGYACGNFALSGGTDGAFDDLGTEHSVAISWIIDTLEAGPNVPYPVYYNQNGVDPGPGARTQGVVHNWKGAYTFRSPEALADDNTPIFNTIPAVFRNNNANMPHGYSLSNGEWNRLQTLWDNAVAEPIGWQKVRFTRRHGPHGGCPGWEPPAWNPAGSGCAAYVTNGTAEPTSTWGDCLRSPGPYEALNAAERLILQNNGPLHNRSSMKFFHKLMKRIAELYGWSIKDYDSAPGRGHFAPANGVGIAVTSCAWWAADHWGFVVTNARNPQGTDMPYAFFQQVPTSVGELDCYGTRLWDETRAFSVLWVDKVPRLVLEKIRDHYY